MGAFKHAPGCKCCGGGPCTGSVCVVVTGCDGKPVSGANVTWSQDGTDLDTKTTSTGEGEAEAIVCEDLPPGAYTIRVTAPTFATFTSGVIVDDACDPQTITAALTPDDEHNCTPCCGGRAFKNPLMATFRGTTFTLNYNATSHTWIGCEDMESGANRVNATGSIADGACTCTDAFARSTETTAVRLELRLVGDPCKWSLGVAIPCCVGCGPIVAPCDVTPSAPFFAAVGISEAGAEADVDCEGEVDVTLIVDNEANACGASLIGFFADPIGTTYNVPITE